MWCIHAHTYFLYVVFRYMFALCTYMYVLYICVYVVFTYAYVVYTYVWFLCAMPVTCEFHHCESFCEAATSPGSSCANFTSGKN